MKNFSTVVLLVVFVVSIVSTSVEAQVIGKIFDKNEVETLFGASVKPVTFSKGILQILLKKASDNIMFMIKDNQLIIRTDDKILYPAGYKIEPTDVYQVFSKNVVVALLEYMMENNKVGDSIDDVEFEMIGDVMIVTYGVYSLEFGISCPPYCP